MNYDQIRYHLFSKSYVCNAIIEEIRKKHNINGNQTSSDWLKNIIKDHFSLLEEIRIESNKQFGHETTIDWGFIWLNQDRIESILLPEVSILAKHLNFDQKMLMINILYSNVPNKISTPEGIFFANKFRPISEDGVYLKVSKTTTEKEILASLREAKKYMTIVKSSKNNENSLKILKDKKRKDISKKDEFNHKVFISVEEKIKQLVKEKVEKKADFEYEGEIVRPAIEQIVGDLINKTGNEDNFDKYEIEWNKKITNIYYSILDRYQLPTYKQLKPILGLINS